MQIEEWFDFRPFVEKKVHWANIKKASLVTAMKPKQLKKQKKKHETGAQIDFKEWALSIIFSQNWFCIPYQLLNNPKKINLLKMNIKSVDWIVYWYKIKFVFKFQTISITKWYRTHLIHNIDCVIDHYDLAANVLPFGLFPLEWF